MSDHTFYKCEQPCHKPHCMFCDGGLGFCTVCQAGEGTLPQNCPGKSISQEDQDLIYKSTLDFRDGQWCKRTSLKQEWFHPDKAAIVEAAVIRLNKAMGES